MRRHEGESYFVVKCCYCYKMYMTVKYWRLHVLTHEPAPEAVSERNADGECSQGDFMDVEDGVATAATPNDERSEHDERFSSQKELSSLIIQLRAKNVTQDSCREVVASMTRFCEEAVQQSRGLVF